MESLLKIQGVGLPPFSARGCKQELVPIPNGVFRNTVNGKLMFLKTSDLQRYKTIIKCNDVNTPTLGNLFIGNEIEIECIQSIWQAVDPKTEKVELIRDYVPDSIVLINKNCKEFNFEINGLELSINPVCDEQLFVTFRPKLKMKITNFYSSNDEWELNSSWQLEAEESGY